eukprot:scaffold1166_cov261-Pinguiococcus_pyrenoidosus.AAC.22
MDGDRLGPRVLQPLDQIQGEVQAGLPRVARSDLDRHRQALRGRGIDQAFHQALQLLGLLEQAGAQAAPGDIVRRTAAVEVDDVTAFFRSPCDGRAALVDGLGRQLADEGLLVPRPPKLGDLDEVAALSHRSTAGHLTICHVGAQLGAERSERQVSPSGQRSQHDVLAEGVGQGCRQAQVAFGHRPWARPAAAPAAAAAAAAAADHDHHRSERW